MRRIVPYACFILLGLGSVGCQRTAINERYERAVESARARADERFVYTSCEGGGVADHCGLILKHVARASFRERFREKACADVSGDACQARYNRFVDAQLLARYTAAAWSDVATYCDGHPPRCDDPIAYELLLVDSHNGNVRAELANERVALHNERHRALAADTELTMGTVSGVLTEVAYAAHDGPKCRSYPSVLTGTTVTLCR